MSMCFCYVGVTNGFIMQTYGKICIALSFDILHWDGLVVSLSASHAVGGGFVPPPPRSH